MVRNYVRKTERQQWNVSNMQRAIFTPTFEQITLKYSHFNVYSISLFDIYVVLII